MQIQEELVRHIKDLANRAYEQNIYTFTEFLTQAEQSDVLSMERELSFVGLTFSGGADFCERRMVRFGKPEQMGYEEDFPISCIEIKPLAQKFADELSHRDFLGALMNLGVKREVLGDIVVKNNQAYVFCEEKMAGYICENLTRVRHTSVSCAAGQGILPEAEPEKRTEEHIVASNRADAIIARVFSLSRNQALELFRRKEVFVDGRIYENNSAVLRDGAVVSVRGHGKFEFDGFLNETRKGRIRISVRRYI